MENLSMLRHTQFYTLKKKSKVTIFKWGCPMITPNPDMLMRSLADFKESAKK
jgi:hypothetical protein